jgi:hypothetical protein
MILKYYNIKMRCVKIFGVLRTTNRGSCVKIKISTKLTGGEQSINKLNQVKTFTILTLAAAFWGFSPAVSNG